MKMYNHLSEASLEKLIQRIYKFHFIHWLIHYLSPVEKKLVSKWLEIQNYFSTLSHLVLTKRSYILTQA